MKITYVINSRFPTERAHGAHVMKMCEAFVQQGVEVELVVPRRSNHITESPYEYYAVTPNKKIRVTYLPVLDLVPWGIPFAFALETFTFALACSYYIRRTRPDIIYTRGESVLFLARIITDTTALFWETHIKPDGMVRYRKIFNKITGFITVTKIYADELVEAYHLRRDRVMCAPDGIDPSFFIEYSKSEARRELGLPNDARVVMYMGLFEPWKGVETLFKAAAALREKKIIVAVAGGHPAQVDEFKKKYPAVLFLGFTEYRRQPKLQPAADVLVVPNSAKFLMSTNYTSPLKVFAHMASGIPMIVSDIPSIREVLDERNSNFFEPDNVPSLTERILDIFKNYDQATEKAGRAKIVARKYLWTERAQMIIRFIENKI